ncbi:class I SAM-dependent DNA methyltransferase [Brevundimonas sp. FT23042]|uniref:class I SAM-dependent DNA methyltransferase n=1 Tax=Brevundimonas sp. FT23042 TaxID=3393749 RepID=UPI003B585C74
MSRAADGIIDLYSRHAADWDADRGRDLTVERPWLESFLGHVPNGGQVLDLGCGSGEPVARYLIERGRVVTGVDASPGAIALCRERFPGQDWIVADMRGLDLGRTFDGLIAWHSSFHLTRDDQRALFEVYARHIRPGGVLMFTSGDQDGEAFGEWRGEPLYHASLSSSEYRKRLENGGFQVLTDVVGDDQGGGATVWLARRVGGRMGE